MTGISSQCQGLQMGQLQQLGGVEWLSGGLFSHVWCFGNDTPKDCAPLGWVSSRVEHLPTASQWGWGFWRARPPHSSRTSCTASLGHPCECTSEQGSSITLYDLAQEVTLCDLHNTLLVESVVSPLILTGGLQTPYLSRKAYQTMYGNFFKKKRVDSSIPVDQKWTLSENKHRIITLLEN